jgi:16S rRNA (guanine527-N7)-methyltransferase
MTGRESFAHLDVSRETLQRLEAYEGLLNKWNPTINLVSPATLSQLWSRHFLDSAQLLDLAGRHLGLWADLGSGGGFPGLVLAILAKEKQPGRPFVLVESDQRKAAFLMTVARELDLSVTVRSERIEAVSPLGADVLSARALAALDRLLGFAALHLAEAGVAIFPKGASWREELAEARKSWSFSVQSHPSLTDPEAAILTISEVSRV